MIIIYIIHVLLEHKVINTPGTCTEYTEYNLVRY